MLESHYSVRLHLTMQHNFNSTSSKPNPAQSSSTEPCFLVPSNPCYKPSLRELRTRVRTQSSEQLGHFLDQPRSSNRSVPPSQIVPEMFGLLTGVQLPPPPKEESSDSNMILSPIVSRKDYNPSPLLLSPIVSRRNQDPSPSSSSSMLLSPTVSRKDYSWTSGWAGHSDQPVGAPSRPTPSVSGDPDHSPKLTDAFLLQQYNYNTQINYLVEKSYSQEFDPSTHSFLTTLQVCIPKYKASYVYEGRHQRKRDSLQKARIQCALRTPLILADEPVIQGFFDLLLPSKVSTAMDDVSRTAGVIDTNLSSIRETTESVAGDVSSTSAQITRLLSHVSDFFESLKKKVKSPPLAILQEVVISSLFALYQHSILPILQCFTTIAAREASLRQRFLSFVDIVLHKFSNLTPETAPTEPQDYEQLSTPAIRSLTSAYPEAAQYVAETLSAGSTTDDLFAAMQSFNFPSPPPADAYEIQGFADDAPSVDFIARVVSGALVLVGMVCFGVTNFSMNSLMNQTSLIGRACKGFQDFKSCFTQVIDFVEDIVYKCVYGMNKDEYLRSLEYPDITEAMTILVYFKNVSKPEILLNACPNSTALFLTALKLARKYVDTAHSRGHRDIVARLKDVITDIKHLENPARLAASGDYGFRVPPVVVKLGGPAGIGKSELTNLLIKDLADQLYPDSPLNSLIYQRKAVNEYWDGYAGGNMFCVFDDFMQAVDSQSRPNPEIQEIISAANSSPFQLHMSDVKDKANHFFKSQFILLSTNDVAMRPRSIVSREALIRRFDLDVSVSIHPNFSRPALHNNAYHVPDEFKIWRAMPGNADKTRHDYRLAAADVENFTIPILKDIYQFTLTDRTTGLHHQHLSYDQFYTLIVNAHHRKLNSHKDKMEATPSAELPDELVAFRRMLPQGAPDLDQQETLGVDAAPEIEYSVLRDNVLLKKCRTIARSIYAGMTSLTCSSFSTPFFRVLSWLRETWPVIAAVLAFSAGTAAVTYLCARECRVAKKLREGGEIHSLFSASLCTLSCALCKALKSGPVRTIPLIEVGRRMKYCPTALSKFFIHLAGVASSLNLSVHPSFLSSISSDFTLESIEAMKAQSHVSTCNGCTDVVLTLESHQDSRLQKPLVESHQQANVKLPFLESHQDSRAMLPKLESQQDSRVKLPHVEGDFVTESFSELKATPWSDIFDTQGSFDDNASVISNNVLAKNLVRVTVPGTKAFAHGLLIRGRQLLLNQHMSKQCPHIEITYAGEPASVKHQVSILSRQQLSRNGVPIDAVILELGNSINAAPDITTHFPAQSELSALPSLIERGRVNMLKTIIAKVGKPILIPCFEPVTNIQCVDKITARDPKSDSVYHTAMGLRGRANSILGDCGAPYMLYNPASRSKIVSIHTCGSPGFAISQILTKEDLAVVAPQGFSAISTDYSGLNLLHAETSLPNSSPLGTIPSSTAAPKSQIEKSPIHGLFPVEKAPAILDHPSVDILYKNSLKMTKETVLLDETLLDTCFNSVRKVFSRNPCSFKKVLTHEESIEGIEGFAYINGINRSTSPGWPYTLMSRTKPGKRQWLGTDEYKTDDPTVLQHVNRIVDAAKQGVVRPIDGIFSASLKDERRTLQKVEELKTRVFTASNMGLTLAIRRYFMAFMQHIMDNRIYNEIGLGLNVYSNDWQTLATRLCYHSDRVIAGDFSNFDGSLNAQILYRIVDVVNRWYGDSSENQLIRRVLCEYIFNASVNFRGTVAQMNHSQPSGNPLTTMINCLYNMFIFRYVYLLAQKAAGLPQTLSSFEQHVAAVYYGDDSIIALLPCVLPWFNQNTITEHMATTGHVYTDETKSGVPLPSRSLSQVTFLKRAFVCHQGDWIAPLDTQTIRDMVMWSRTTITTAEAVSQTTRAASFEAYFHGKEYFQEYTQKVANACSNAGYSDDCMSWQECCHLHNECKKGNVPNLW